MAEVSIRTLIRRLNRKLAHENQVLKTSRKTSRWYEKLGDYYILDVGFNTVTHTHLDLEAYGREIGCLSDSETFTDQPG